MKIYYAISVSVFSIIIATSPALGNTNVSATSANKNVAFSDNIHDGIEDIVVTAQRREESLQKVPVAITALTAETLDNSRALNINNLSGLAPNVQIETQGLQSTPAITIRGVLSGASDNAVDPKVGIYLDGVYIGRSVGAIFDLADLSRVEVLRGPQGTLFGRNSTGGAISLISAAPTGEFGI